MSSVRLERRSGSFDLMRPDGAVATLALPGQPARRISMGRRALAECLADELHRLDPDEIYAETLTKGLARIDMSGISEAASHVIRHGESPP
jgi:glucose-6-phosphate dehydrogenase assembly protein OpcA